MQTNALTLVDDPSAPEIFVSGAVGVIFARGNLHVTFATVRADYTGGRDTPVEIVNLRLVMPAERAQLFAGQLYEYAKQNVPQEVMQ